MNALLELKSLEKVYGDKTVVDKLSFQVEDGEILGLLGPNGAGKSTTIRMITGLENMQGGDIFYKGTKVKQNQRRLQMELGVVPQEIALYQELTAYENVRFFASLYGLKGELLKQRCYDALERVGLSEYASKRPDTFSGGMKRRLNIACSIAHRPKLLIMDEPTVGIDPQSRNHIMNTIRILQEEGTTVIYVSHYMEEIESLCSRIVLMDHGIVKEDLPLSLLREKYDGKSLEEIFLLVTGTALRDKEA
ncbi:export ABC transporter ATP-binding protein [Lachnospiraceae bacterium KM106-2]|nr:export ABC transporter ATP-binding protein [Lachnospiraceae bacterium KM106-2]